MDSWYRDEDAGRTEQRDDPVLAWTWRLVLLSGFGAFALAAWGIKLGVRWLTG